MMEGEWRINGGQSAVTGLSGEEWRSYGGLDREMKTMEGMEWWNRRVACCHQAGGKWWRNGRRLSHTAAG